jgi:hypothetical protein
MSISRTPVKLLSYLLVVALFLMSQSVLDVQAQSTTLTLKPVADSYVYQSNPSTNYGSNTALRLDGSPVMRSYLRFNLSGLNGQPVTSAKLRLYANSSSSVGLNVNTLADNSWQESNITYANAPAPGSLIKAAGKFSKSTWVTVDITSYVQSEGSINLVLTAKDNTAINLSSREAGSKAPQLVVVYGVANPPTATATKTANPPTRTPTRTVVPPTNTPTRTAPPPTNTPTRTTLPPTDTPAVPSKTPTRTVTASPTTPSGDYQPAFPIRAAFYYPWFPEAWNQQGMNPFTNYHPSLGYYDSSDTSIIKQHIAAMQYGNIQAGIASWWGQGSKTDGRVSTILSATAGTNFRWALYYENESQGDPSASQITKDLTYIRDHYGNDPSYLRVNGRFVIFVYAFDNDGCGMADRWKQGNTVNAYVVLKVFPGYASCASQPDGWHQYSPAVATDSQGSYSYAISPGFWKAGDPVRLARDFNRWKSNIKSMVASSARFQLVETFSEWGEGTTVESAQEWSSASGYGQYLDALHTNGN